MSKPQNNGAKLYDAEAEKCVLGTLLTGRGAIQELETEIDPNLFFVPAHLKVLDAIIDLYQDEKPADIITVTQCLRSDGKLESVGGPYAVTELGTSYAKGVEIARYELSVMRDLHAKRRMAFLAERMQRGDADPDTAIKELTAIVEAAGNRRNGLPAISDVSNLISSEIVLPPDVIHGLLHAGGKMVIGGGSKSFKTWQLIDLATAVATGTEYLGFETNQGRVLYINFEIQPGFFSERCKVVADAKDISPASGSFDVWNLRGHSAELSRLLPAMLQEAGVGKYALIIVDPIYKVLGEREENVTHHITAIMNDLEKLAVRSGAAVAFGAHFSKGNQAGKESIDRISGSGAFARAPDSILVFTKHEEEDAYTVEATLRNHKPIEPFVVRWQFPLMERDEALNPARLKQAGGRPRAATETQILDLLDDKIRAKEWQKLAREELGVSERTFYEMLSELKTRGRVEKIAGYYVKT
jgi:hypothetical protein